MYNRHLDSVDQFMESRTHRYADSFPTYTAGRTVTTVSAPKFSEEESALISSLVAKFKQEAKSNSLVHYGPYEELPPLDERPLHTYFVDKDGWKRSRKLVLNNVSYEIIEPVKVIPDEVPSYPQGIIRPIDNIPKIPKELFVEIIGSFNRIYKRDGNEAAAQIYRNADDKYFIYYPEQTVSTASVSYTNDPNMLENRSKYTLVMELHSHNSMGAFWSSTDNNNEKELCYYIVIGRFGSTTCEYKCRVKYGDVITDLTLRDIFDIEDEAEEKSILLYENVGMGNEIIDSKAKARVYTSTLRGYGGYDIDWNYWKNKNKGVYKTSGNKNVKTPRIKSKKEACAYLNSMIVSFKGNYISVHTDAKALDALNFLYKLWTPDDIGIAYGFKRLSEHCWSRLTNEEVDILRKLTPAKPDDKWDAVDLKIDNVSTTSETKEETVIELSDHKDPEDSVLTPDSGLETYGYTKLPCVTDANEVVGESIDVQEYARQWCLDACKSGSKGRWGASEADLEVASKGGMVVDYLLGLRNDITERDFWHGVIVDDDNHTKLTFLSVLRAVTICNVYEAYFNISYGETWGKDFTALFQEYTADEPQENADEFIDYVLEAYNTSNDYIVPKNAVYEMLTRADKVKLCKLFGCNMLDLNEMFADSKDLNFNTLVLLCIFLGTSNSDVEELMNSYVTNILDDEGCVDPVTYLTAIDKSLNSVGSRDLINYMNYTLMWVKEK